MKILVLNYEFPPIGGGASPVSKDIAIQLHKLGHEVVVLTMGFEDLPEKELVDGVWVYRLKCLRSKKNVCKPWEQYTYILAVRLFMKSHVELQKFDVCHAHFIIPTAEAARWIKKSYGIPYVITAHGSDVEGHNQKIFMKMMHKVLRGEWRRIVDASEGVIAPSEYLMDLMKRNYPAGKYLYISNGIDWEKYHALSAKNTKQKKILVMGRLQKFKNVQTIILAISVTEMQGWQVDVLGDGPYKKELMLLVEELNLQDRISFHGWLDHGTKEQMDYLEHASVYITASQFENCPMAVIEAIAAGCYPLLSNIPGHRQFVDDNDYFFEAEDSIELSKRLTDILMKEPVEIASCLDVYEYDWSRIIYLYDKKLREINMCRKKGAHNDNIRQKRIDR